MKTKIKILPGTYAEPTPGPWHNPIESVSVFAGQGKSKVKICDANWSTSVVQAEANARLIAAAPELLEACTKALEQFGYIWPLLRDRADFQPELRAAIAKAQPDKPVVEQVHHKDGNPTNNDLANLEIRRAKV